MPKLQVVDFLDNKHLKDVTFKNCPSIITVDSGFNFELKETKGINNVEYLSTQFYSSLKHQTLKKIIFQDYFNDDIFDLKIFNDQPNLECLCCYFDNTKNISEITPYPSLQILETPSAFINYDSINKNRQIKDRYLYPL